MKLRQSFRLSSLDKNHTPTSRLVSLVIFVLNIDKFNSKHCISRNLNRGSSSKLAMTLLFCSSIRTTLVVQDIFGNVHMIMKCLFLNHQLSFVDLQHQRMFCIEIHHLSRFLNEPCRFSCLALWRHPSEFYRQYCVQVLADLTIQNIGLVLQI